MEKMKASDLESQQHNKAEPELLSGYFQWLSKLRSAHHQFAEPLSLDGSYPTSVKYIDKDLVWKHYQLQMDLYKHYLDLVIKFNVFYYAITGGFLSYYFANFNNPWVSWALALPVIMSLFYALLFFKSSRAVKYLNEEIGNISLMFGFMKPEVNILKYSLVASGILFSFVSFGLAIVFISRN